jgi:hypothetical protein
MQVDGEPCLLGPSLIHLSFHNKVPMLRREKFARMSGSAPANNIVSMNANRRKSSNNSTQTGGANSSGGGGGSPSITQHRHHQTTATGTMATAPPPASQHKSSRASSPSPFSSILIQNGIFSASGQPLRGHVRSADCCLAPEQRVHVCPSCGCGTPRLRHLPGHGGSAQGHR